MAEILKKAAEILVACDANYSAAYEDGGVLYIHHTCGDSDADTYLDKVEPFADTLEGRRQADAIEDWLRKNQLVLWAHNSLKVPENHSQASEHLQRLARIKWCLEQLMENSNG